jgi:hypothetical protein
MSKIKMGNNMAMRLGLMMHVAVVGSPEMGKDDWESAVDAVSDDNREGAP